jgi:hypothetical protein
MPSGHDPMGGYRFSKKIMLRQKENLSPRFVKASYIL